MSTTISSPEGASLQQGVLSIMSPLFSFLWRIKVVGRDQLPTDGPAILAANHNSVIDSFFLPVVAGRPVFFVGKAEYLDDWKTRRLFPALGMIPIDRSGGDASTRALDAAAEVLDGGHLFGIYPEGTRSRCGLLHKGHTGVARLSVSNGAPIIPVGILGTRAIQPRGSSIPKCFRPAEIRFGRPIYPAESTSVTDARLRYRQMTDELMFEIRALTGQVYVNEYATKAETAAAETLQSTGTPEMPERRSSADVLGAAGP
ncbi:MAG: lysophospholipid acyltransferase family protein [Acidimicrobiales bacterium]|nr:lysophospholipid acyltransferase family protein [Acidimicrobiales bacterium]MDG2216896.1 lysophospholipid acyltransferase family protein [Acidimicrobiales bacterium]